MRAQTIMITVLAAMGVAACGSADRQAGPTTSVGGSPRQLLAGNKPVRGISYNTHQLGPYRNDGDHDLVGDEDGDNRSDVDNDAPWDYKPEVDENGRYHDADDAPITRFGHPASSASRSAITKTVKSYYADAAAGNGSAGCTLLLPSYAKALPLDYGELGPSYVRGAKTCAAVLVRIFGHSHYELVAPIAVTDVRVKGPHALALIGSARMPASSIALQRSGSGWTVAQLLGVAMQ